MREKGVVTEIKGGTTVVSVDKREECAGCGLCVFNDGTGKSEFYAKTQSGVKLGDTVIVERSENGRFLGVLLVFFIPLMLIGLSVLVNYLLIKNEIWILVLSGGFIAAWYAVLALLDKKFKTVGAFNSVIVEVVPKDENDKERDLPDTKE
ncbi:MAG: SoxR reducing system RseC family protein [Clostridia bacterium]|nr:SoxR reducing system RseC family protein [Clostridia bacterium]